MLDAGHVYAAFYTPSGVRVFFFDGAAAAQVGSTLSGGLCGIHALAAADPSHLWLSTGPGGSAGLYSFSGADWAPVPGFSFSQISFSGPSTGYAVGQAPDDTVRAFAYSAGAWNLIGSSPVVSDLSVSGGTAYFRQASSNAFYSFNGTWNTVFPGYATGNNAGRLGFCALSEDFALSVGEGEDAATFEDRYWVMKRGRYCTHQAYDTATGAWLYDLPALPYPELNTAAATVFCRAGSNGWIYVMGATGQAAYLASYGPEGDWAFDLWHNLGGEGVLAKVPDSFAAAGLTGHMVETDEPDLLYVLSDRWPAQTCHYKYVIAENQFVSFEVQPGPSRLGGMCFMSADGNCFYLFGGLDARTGAFEEDVQRYNYLPVAQMPAGIESSLYSPPPGWQATSAAIAADIPGGAAVRLYIRTGPTDDPDGDASNWTSWRRAAAPGYVPLECSTFLQYRLELASAPGGQPPVVGGVSVTFTSPTDPGLGICYLAEGCTYPGYQTYILLCNPSSRSVDVTCYFMCRNPVYAQTVTTVPARSRRTIDVNALDNGVLFNQEVSTVVRYPADVPLAVSRTVLFSDWKGRLGSTGAQAVEAPSTRWYFAEGCVRPGFDTWFCVQNNNYGRDAHVALHYFTGTGEYYAQQLTVPPFSRGTADPSAALGRVASARSDFSAVVESDIPVVVERSCYFTYGGQHGQVVTGGHCSSGSTTHAPGWYAAEGCTRRQQTDWFDTYLLVFNMTASPSRVRVSLTGGVTWEETVNPCSRFTIKLNDRAPEADVSCLVETMNGVPVVVERATYFNHNGIAEGTSSTCYPSAHPTWYVAQGYNTPGNYNTFICVVNASNQNIWVDLTFMTETRGITCRSLGIMGPFTRRTLNESDVPELTGQGTGCQVTATGPIVVEEATYGSAWDRKGAETTLGRPSNEPFKKLHKLAGINLTGSNYPWVWYDDGCSSYDAVSVFMDDPSTHLSFAPQSDGSYEYLGGDEGFEAKAAYFRNPLIYVPYDMFLDDESHYAGVPNLVIGIDKYSKIFAELKAWNPDSITVCFIARRWLPPAPTAPPEKPGWPGWGMTPNGTWNQAPGQRPPALEWTPYGGDPNARYALGLDLDNWSKAIRNFCLQDFARDVKYFEVWDEPGADITAGPEQTCPETDAGGRTWKVYRLYGDCVTDYPAALSCANYWIKSMHSPKDPVVICGSLQRRSGVSYPQFAYEENNPSMPKREFEDSFAYYRALKGSLTCDAIGLHLFQRPWDDSMPTRDQAAGYPLINYTGDPRNTWVSGYNWLRNGIFGDDSRPIYVTSCGWPWADQQYGLKEGGFHTVGTSGYENILPTEDYARDSNGDPLIDKRTGKPIMTGHKIENTFPGLQWAQHPPPGYGFDGLLRNTSCPGVWYCRDVTVAPLDNLMPEYYGLGVTCEYAKNHWNSFVMDQVWPQWPQPTRLLWDSYMNWVRWTDSLR